ncbi:Six-hairpin glycosidase-like protein [Gautieria morchelliformis]|nr:Six-hairpin glycosidase-like protein [Gautieria morchelliformis]
MAVTQTHPNKATAYQCQVDYALGKNPMSAPYLVGSNPNSPSNPHLALASAYVLYGGVVGGPDCNDNFYDIRRYWPETEISLDYVAPMLSIAAYSVLTNPDDPFYTSLQPGGCVPGFTEASMRSSTAYEH